MRIRMLASYLLALTCFAGTTRAGGGAAAPVMPEIVVSPLQEEQSVGAYNQPEWTTERRFPTTRVYLQQPPYSVGVEQWVRSKYYEGKRGKHRIQEEVEIGLPHRFQVDLYENMEMNEHGTLYHDNVALEIRYALADWGRIPMNPTVYAEYKLKDEADDVVEAKLLLGDELARAWHWGVNLVYEGDVGGEERVREYAASAALSRTLVDRRLSLGAETLFTTESVDGARGEPENSLNAGPSLQWRPTHCSHVDLVAMPGLTDDAPDLLTYVVLGVDFGRGEEKNIRAPTSLQSN